MINANTKHMLRFALSSSVYGGGGFTRASSVKPEGGLHMFRPLHRNAVPLPRMRRRNKWVESAQ